MIDMKYLLTTLLIGLAFSVQAQAFHKYRNWFPEKAAGWSFAAEDLTSIKQMPQGLVSTEFSKMFKTPPSSATALARIPVSGMIVLYIWMAENKGKKQVVASLFNDQTCKNLGTHYYFEPEFANGFKVDAIKVGASQVGLIFTAGTKKAELRFKGDNWIFSPDRKVPGI
jgi:hypothetical protein